MASRYDIGFLGGGQLARMSIQAAQRMGLRCLSLDPGTETPASQVAAAIRGKLDDPEKIAEVFKTCDRVTLENEFIPASSIRRALRMSGRSADVLLPGVDALEIVQDKLSQRRALAAAGVPSPHAVELLGDAEAARSEIGFPMVLKARFGGYDGKGTCYARTEESLADLRARWGAGGWLAESFVPFKRELAVMVWISSDGQHAGAFPTMETVQENHMCSLVYPSGTDATAIAISAVRAVEGRGLFGVELFELEDGSFQVNELAPRPHNTGHYTLDWGAPSQFDAHVRATMDFSLTGIGDPTGTRPVAMANLLGQSGDPVPLAPALRHLLADHPEVRFHWYGKSESRPGRKMGHLNVVSSGQESARQLADKAVESRTVFYQRLQSANAG